MLFKDSRTSGHDQIVADKINKEKRLKKIEDSFI
jgi:hypothetical protein